MNDDVPKSSDTHVCLIQAGGDQKGHLFGHPSLKLTATTNIQILTKPTTSSSPTSTSQKK
jgi:hypothetical protein